MSAPWWLAVLAGLAGALGKSTADWLLLRWRRWRLKRGHTVTIRPKGGRWS